MTVQQTIDSTLFVRVIISLTTILAIVSLLFRMWLYTYWIDYKSSKQFYFKLMELQKNSRDDAPDAKEEQQKFKKESNLWKFINLIFSWEFIFEFCILVIHPLPGVEQEYTFEIIDMMSSKSKYLKVQYKLSDFLFALMFIRLYFLVRTLLNFTIYSDLYSKRVCSKYGFEASVSFYVKALFVKQPGVVILMVSSLSILFLSYVLRIFERYLLFI